MKRDLPEQLQFMANRVASQKTCSLPMTGKTCVVTGATSGVGLEAVRSLAAGGARVIMVCRNRQKAESLRTQLTAAYPVQIDIATGDFSDLDQVRAVAATLLAGYPRIDLLINSAGLHSTTRHITPAGLEQVFCVNHLAPFLLTSLLLDRLRASAPARIIQVNSEGHRFSAFHPDDYNWKRRRYTGLKSYGASKTAQLLSVWEFADRLKDSGVTINAMHPGDVRTAIGSNNGLLYRTFLHTVIWPFLKDPVISGSALYWMAASPELDGVSGRFFHLTVPEKPAAHALDREKGRQVWELSRRVCSLEL